MHPLSLFLSLSEIGPVAQHWGVRDMYVQHLRPRHHWNNINGVLPHDIGRKGRGSPSIIQGKLERSHDQREDWGFAKGVSPTVSRKFGLSENEDENQKKAAQPEQNEKKEENGRKTEGRTEDNEKTSGKGKKEERSKKKKLRTDTDKTERSRKKRKKCVTDKKEKKQKEEKC